MSENSTGISKEDSEKINDLTSAWLKEVLPLFKGSDNQATSILTLLIAVQSAMLPMAALAGGVATHPEYNLKQRMVYMGNRTVAQTVESLEDAGKLTMIEAMDAMRQMFDGLENDDDNNNDTDS